jgi:hypothetical protein
MAYNDYLKSNHWKQTRENRLSFCDHCQICDSKEKLHIHHGRYEIYGKAAEKSGVLEGSILGRERVKDLFVLCASCHRFWHLVYGHDFPRHKTLSKIRRLIKVGVIPPMAIKISKTQAYNAILEKANHLQKKASGSPHKGLRGAFLFVDQGWRGLTAPLLISE